MSNLNRKFFFDTVRLTLFYELLWKVQVESLTALLDYWEKYHAAKDDRWLSYVLETAHPEVDRKMQPLKEYGRDSYFFRMYDIEGGRPKVAKRLSEGYGAELVIDDGAMQIIKDRCTEIESGGQMIDAILTNTLEGGALTRVMGDARGFGYDFA